jgi:phage terminase large subunit-like protein
MNAEPTLEQLEEMKARLAAERERRIVENALARYLPYDRQREFHDAGATHRERLLCAANQSGKTLAGGFEVAMHATGRYPDWWKGARFDAATIGWVCGTTNETTRDTVQRTLVGRPGYYGTGAIPKDAIIEAVSARGTADLLDHVKVRHASGGVSTIDFKSYQRGRESFQGETLHYVWFDEEPPADIYTEGLTRTNVHQAPVWLTFTPLLGMSDTVGRFLLEVSPDRHVVTMTIDDIGHFSPEERAKIIASYPPHEREARTKGIPTLGSGRIFPVADDLIACEAIQIPRHWPCIGAAIWCRSIRACPRPCACSCTVSSADGDVIAYLETHVVDFLAEIERKAAELTARYPLQAA